MTDNRFRYRLDKRCRTITWITVAATALVFGVLTFFTFGAYLPAWFLSIAAAVIGLSILSIPRSIRITPQALEIRCVVEITHIPYEHIKSIGRIGRTELRRVYPIFASPGFFGYYGYWLDTRNWDIIKVYASSRHGLVIIEDIYEQRYIVSSERADELINAVRAECRRCRAEQ